MLAVHMVPVLVEWVLRERDIDLQLVLGLAIAHNIQDLVEITISVGGRCHGAVAALNTAVSRDGLVSCTIPPSSEAPVSGLWRW